jgi:hypothetical protein
MFCLSKILNKYPVIEKIMKIAEILLEYQRDVTAKNMGVQLLIALTKDSGNLPHQLSPFRSGFKDDPVSRINQFMAIPETSKLIDTFINDILEYIESKDPTQNKQYTQWLARVYSKGGLKIEDMNRQNILGLYDAGKRRGMINPEHTDINKFKSYRDFEDAIIPYDLSAKLWASDKQKKMDKGKSKEVYKDANVRIIVTEDEAAACYYGQGTRWCTAGDSNNQFDNYNSSGKLYIMLPKSPAYPGEKYQLHFPDSQFMDPKDDPIDIRELLEKRFPNTLEFFKKVEPTIEKMVVFASDEILQKLLNEIREIVYDYVSNKIGEWEDHDDYYHKWLTDNGYATDDGDIDWDKVYDDNHGYTDYNDDARDFYNNATEVVSMTPEYLRQSAQDFTRGVRDAVYNLVIVPSILADEAKSLMGKSDYGLTDFINYDIKIEQKGGIVKASKW